MAEQWLWGVVGLTLLLRCQLPVYTSCSNLKLESGFRDRVAVELALASSFMLLVLLNYPALAKRHVGPGPVGCSQVQNSCL